MLRVSTCSSAFHFYFIPSFREAFSHPYMSFFFHFLVNVFSVIYIGWLHREGGPIQKSEKRRKCGSTLFLVNVFSVIYIGWLHREGGPIQKSEKRRKCGSTLYVVSHSQTLYLNHYAGKGMGMCVRGGSGIL